MISALVFDFDGVIVNTEPLHYRALLEVLEPMGLPFSWEEYLSQYIGFDDRDAIRERHRNAGKTISDELLRATVRRKAAAFHHIASVASAKPFPGAVELIQSAAGRIPLGLCSGALREDVDPILKRLEVDNLFDAMVTADDVEVSKPDPSSYRLILERLRARHPNHKIEAHDALAIEDTPAGVKAAKGAGFKVVAVTNSYGRDKLFDADRIVGSLVGLKF